MRCFINVNCISSATNVPSNHTRNVEPARPLSNTVRTTTAEYVRTLFEHTHFRQFLRTCMPYHASQVGACEVLCVSHRTPCSQLSTKKQTANKVIGDCCRASDWDVCVCEHSVMCVSPLGVWGNVSFWYKSALVTFLWGRGGWGWDQILTEDHHWFNSIKYMTKLSRKVTFSESEKPTPIASQTGRGGAEWH